MQSHGFSHHFAGLLIGNHVSNELFCVIGHGDFVDDSILTKEKLDPEFHGSIKNKLGRSQRFTGQR